MVVTYKSCPLCNSANIAGFLKVKDHLLTHEEFSIWKCANCGLLFTQDIPQAAEIGKYYKSQDYVSHSDTRKGLMNKTYHVARNIMLGKKFRMVNHMAKGKTLLDIGSGTGYFPAYMKAKGYKVTGVEVDQDAREFAKKEFGLTVYSPEDFLENSIEGKFDVISLWHVLEHLDNFDLYIERMLEHLLPGGCLVIALPNCSSLDARHYKEFWAGYDVPRHLWHLTPSTVKILADKHGMQITKMKRLIFDPFYNSMLSEKYKGNRVFMIFGTAIGKLAYIESLFNIKKSSSIVYFLKRKSDSL
jgi:2-polyprenyl-3-methyl-5-hydroxy-6-metoxy-1,4-benzoquinol methylase